MEKILSFILGLICILVIFPVGRTMAAVTPTPDPVYDYECSKMTLLSTSGVDSTGKPLCNLFCERTEIYTAGGVRNTKFCPYGLKTGAVEGSELFANYLVNEFFVPQEDAAIIYIRSGLFVVMGLAGLLLVLYGLYGWYVRSMSAGSPDKVQLSMSIFKNAIIGGILMVVAVVIVQLVYSVMGITQGPFDFNFIPKIGTVVTITDEDIGRRCYSNQTDTNGHTCIEGKWSGTAPTPTPYRQPYLTPI
mgnify:CR=1 FL=1